MNTNFYILLPILSILISTIIGIRFNINETLFSYLRIFTFGLILAAASVETIPAIINLTNHKYQLLVISGIIISAILLYFVRRNLRNPKFYKEVTYYTPIPYIYDALITSLIIGIASNSNKPLSFLFIIALTIQISFAVLTLIDRMKNNFISNKYIITIVSLFIPIIILGYLIGKQITRGNNIYYLVLSLALTSILWILIENILLIDRTNININISTLLVFFSFILVIIIKWFLFK